MFVYVDDRQPMKWNQKAGRGQGPIGVAVGEAHALIGEAVTNQGAPIPPPTSTPPVTRSVTSEAADEDTGRLREQVSLAGGH
ncbi:hypothetical protein E2C01_056002 [Portunus trituberculatus]|uniref:Uncharacterized protein n=1 Tax=Portunus trituberculatus TaxID=210409 RepID=A0A5B7GX28_PORTR|nr:hypothetical protein [Portunus trituberculatus]